MTTMAQPSEPQLPAQFRQNTLLPPSYSVRDMCKVIAAYIFISSGDAVDPEAIYNYSPHGELFEVFFAFYNACLYFNFYTHLALPLGGMSQGDFAIVAGDDGKAKFYYFDNGVWVS